MGAFDHDDVTCGHCQNSTGISHPYSAPVVKHIKPIFSNMTLFIFIFFPGMLKN